MLSRTIRAGATPRPDVLAGLGLSTSAPSSSRSTLDSPEVGSRLDRYPKLRLLPGGPHMSRQLGPSPVQGRRCFHVSSRRRARAVDFYTALEVSKSASQGEIKAQFYKLSKQYHPDVNRDDENAKAKFQQVSEAYATLGSEKNRRQYDSELRSAPPGYTRHHNTSSGSGSAYTGYTYDPEANANRRARASYAWDYQRRRSDTNRSARGAAREAGGATSGRRASSHAGAARAGFGYGTGGIFDGADTGNANSLFEELAARERRKEERRRDSSAFATGQGGQDDSSDGSTPMLRFIQILGVLGLILAIGHKGGSARDGGAGIDSTALKTARTRRSEKEK